MSTHVTRARQTALARHLATFVCLIGFALTTNAQSRGGDVNVDRATANGGFIQSQVWLDTNQDAIRDKDEVGVAGVSVSLLRCDGGFVAATHTDLSGTYQFGRVPAGCYRLRFAAMDGYRYCPTNAGSDTARDSDADPSTGLTKAFDIGINQTMSSLDAGVIALAEPQLGDRVWDDLNANGVQDVGEPGLPNVAVALYDCAGGAITDGGQPVVATSNDSGYFVFEGITPACYSLRVTPPTSYQFSAPNIGLEALDSDVDPASGQAMAGTVDGSTGLFDVDAGLYQLGSIGDWIWFDANGDHMQDAGDSGLGNVQVVLLTADGVPTGRSTESDKSGYYEFSDVVPGAYRLQFALPEGYYFAEPNVSPDPQLDSNANGLGTTAVFNVQSGGQRMDIDMAAMRINDGIPRLDVEKLTNGFDADEEPGPFVEVGGEVLWEYIVTNVGAGPLFNIFVEDDQGVSVSCPQIDLEEGESMVCTGSTNDAQAGQYMNEVYSCGNAGTPDGGLRCDKDLSHYFGSAPGISLEKTTNGEDADTPTGPEIPAGGAVTWEYFVLNTGNVTLTDVVVTDDQGVVVSCPSTTLEPGVSMICTGTGTAIAGQYANLGSVTGTPPVGEPVTDSDPSHYFGTAASIDIEKATNGEDADAPTGPFIASGGDVTWSYVVTNTGSLTLTDVVVADSDPNVNVSCPATTLAPGDSFTCTASGTAVIGQYANDSTVVGQGVDGDGNPVGDPVTDADPSHYFGANPGIDIEKATNGQDADTPTGPAITEGEDVNWTYVVTNTGNVTLIDIVVADDQGVDVSCPENTLAPGGSFTCTGSGTAEVGQYANLGSVVGQGVNPDGDPVGEPVTDEDPSHYFGQPLERASLGDKVFKDLNGNGQQDADEPGVAGITVNLWTDDDGDGLPDTQIATTVTDGDGMYGFMDLDPTLTYVVQFVNDPAMNMPFTSPNVGDDASDSDANADGITGPITLEPGENNPTIDAGLVNLPASLGDKVFKDLDGDGQQGADEPGVAGVTVNLWTDDDGNGTPDTQVDSTTTDGNGMYGFTDLTPGVAYVVQFVVDPAMNMPFTTPNVGDDASDSDAGADGITAPVVLASGENNPTIDAGIVNLPASLGDKVFKDLDGDGQQGADEPGVAGVTVNLWTDDDGDGLPDTQIDSTTTDADGMYGFTDLDPTLTYVVQFVNDPAMNMPFTTPNVGNDASDSDANADGITGPITLASGENNPTIDAGIVNLPASLGDKVFKDLDGDGQQDADEPGVPGVTVNLWTDDDGNGTPDTQVDTTTTDGNGMYGFTDLTPGVAYVVQFVVDPAMNMPFTTPNVGDDASDSDAGADGITAPVVLASGENNPTIDAGIVNLPASLGDKVFKDLDGDGQQGADEPGVAGVTVNLWTDDDGNGTPDTQVDTTTTDGNGMYGFTDLTPGVAYVVQFVVDPAMNMPFTTPNVGDDASDSDAGADGITAPVVLASGENNPTIDAGIVNLPASLGDKVFKDLDGDGQQGADEPGVAGVTVNLWTDDDGNGTPDTQVDSTTTDGNGMYGFTDLTPGVAYVVQFVVDPAMNMPFTTPNVGDDASDSDAGADGITAPVVLASGENNPTIDAGIVNLPASLGDKVFKDLNGDGQQGADEPGVAGVTVNLWTDDDGDGLPDTQIDSTTTDADGMYGFTDLDPTLTYVVQFVNDPAMNMPFTTPNVGNDASDSDANADGITGPITLASGENNPTIDAGIVNVPASLGDKVFKDLDGDGQQDADEPGVPGVTVNLWTDDDGNGTPDTQVDTTTTDGNGMYGFTDLTPGVAYVVQFVVDPAMNMPFTTPNVGDDASDSDAGADGITAPVVLASGENNPTIDAGIVNLPASLGDKVFKDLDGDGQQGADEPGVAGVTVNLWTDDDGNGTPDTQVDSTTTDGNGMYGFTDLTPGVAYVVQFVVDPAMNMPFTTPNVGNDASDSDAGANGITAPVVLASGENNPTIDAGIVNLPAKLGDFVWIDQDRDGVQDAGEPGVAGAVVNLWIDTDGDGQPDQQIATTTTDDTGMYMFSNLTPGVPYIVQFEAIPGKPFTVQTVGNDTQVDSNPNPDTGITGSVVLMSGEFNPTIDAGVIMLGASIDLEKATNGEDADTPTGPVLTVGDAVTWTYVVTNTGELTLTDIVVSDDQGVNVTCPADTLAPGDAFTCTGSGIAEEGQYANLGSVTGQPVDGGDPVGDPVSDDDPSHYFGESAACVDKFAADNFDQVSYSNNDGDMDWASDWHEYDPQGGGAHSGAIRVEDGMLVLTDYPNSGTHPDIRRTVDLTGFNAAMLSFDWSISYEANEHDHANLWISPDGGHTWHLLDSFNGVHGETTTGSEMYDISAFISDNTVIAFQIANNFGAVWDKFMVDNVRVDKKCDECTPGTVADHFSHVSYNNNDGTMDWSGPWHENDPQGGGAHNGSVRVENGMLVLADYPNSGSTPWATREVDLTGHNSAMLMFDWSISLEANDNDEAQVKISPDGGHSWYVLDTFRGVHGDTNGGAAMYDITPYISANTVIKFKISKNFGAVWDKFMVDNVVIEKKCEPTDPFEPQSCDADETPRHAFWFSNFNGDGVTDQYDLDPGATFVQNDDGTATLTGRIRKQHEPSYAFDIHVSLSGRTDNAPDGSPYNPFGANPADWQYYPNWSGTLVGAEWNSGATLSIERRGASFQIGTGANAHDGEQNVYGGSGWFDWTTSGQPHDCHYYGDCIASHGNGDINVRLHCD